MNAPAQPVPQVMPWLMPDKITEALWQARGHLEPVTKSENADDPERPYGYLAADGVVSAGEKAFRKAGLLLLFTGADVKLVGNVLVASRAAVLKHPASNTEYSLGLHCWPLPVVRPGRQPLDVSQAMSAALTMSTARAYREALAMVGGGA